MPPLPNVNKVIRATLLWTIGSNVNALSHLFYSYTGGPPTAGDCAAIAGIIDGNFNAAMLSFFHVNNGLRGVVVLDLNSDTGAEGQTSTLRAGTRAGTAVAAGTAVVTQEHIARRYRGGHPRTYVPALTADDLFTTQEWAPAALDGFLVSWRAFVNNNAGASGGTTALSAHVAVSYISKVVNPVPPYHRPVPLVDPVTSITALASPGSQRRRNKTG
jgi:hypothetical protein